MKYIQRPPKCAYKYTTFKYKLFFSILLTSSFHFFFSLLFLTSSLSFSHFFFIGKCGYCFSSGHLDVHEYLHQQVITRLYRVQSRDQRGQTHYIVINKQLVSQLINQLLSSQLVSQLEGMFASSQNNKYNIIIIRNTYSKKCIY